MSASFAGKRITIVGLGHFGGGIGVSKWLAAQGARVTITDKAAEKDLADGIAAMKGVDVKFRLGGHDLADFTHADLLVVSPAVPPANEFVAAARAAGVPVTTEIQLFIQRNPSQRVLAVTGTKGKSTTTSMLAAILRAAGTTWLGGNIGGTLLDDLPRIKPTDFVVLELSSYMLHYLGQSRFRPNVSVVTMLAPDHLEWHGGFEPYVDAKRNIVRHQTPADSAVLCSHDALSATFAAATQARVIWYGNPDARPLPIKLIGDHNQTNAQAAAAAAQCVGVPRDTAERALADFNPLRHRLEPVHSAAGIDWYNDSIATVPQAAAVALRAFPARRVIQIVGGSTKKLDLTPMIDALAQHAKAAICIAQTGPDIAIALRARGGPCAVHERPNLVEAVALAKQIATAGDVVLLSPGCASYGEFHHFEERGDCFAALARD